MCTRVQLPEIWITAVLLLAGFTGTGEAAGRALLQQTLQGPYLPDVLASQNGGWQCQGNTCQRKHMTYDDMWLFYHMFYEPPAPPPPPPPEKELVIKRVYGCHDDDDDPIYCKAIDRRIDAAMSSIDHLSESALVRRVPSLGLANPAPRLGAEDSSGFLAADGIPDLVSQALQDARLADRATAAGMPRDPGLFIAQPQGQLMPQPEDFRMMQDPSLPLQPRQLSGGVGPEPSMAIQISALPGAES